MQSRYVDTHMKYNAQNLSNIPLPIESLRRINKCKCYVECWILFNSTFIENVY